MDGTIRDRGMAIAEIIRVGGGKMTRYLSITLANGVFEHLVPGHHSAGTEMMPNTEEQAC